MDNLEKMLSGIFNLNFAGYIIPHTWYQHISLDNGKPELIRIILADIVYTMLIKLALNVN